MTVRRKLKLFGIYGGVFAGLFYGTSYIMGKSDQVNLLVGGLIRGMRCGVVGLIVARKYLKVIIFKYFIKFKF